MRLLVADCTVTYRGRLDAHLPPATRLIMVKADGCVAVHADGGAYKPLNWMTSPNTVVEEKGRLVVTNPRGEELVIELHAVHLDTEIDLGEDPGLEKDGVEADLQRLLAERPETLGDGLELVRREYPTPIGPVDLLLRDPDGGTVAVEVKRRGEIDGVEQLVRYLEFLRRDRRLVPVRGLLVAQVVRPQARLLAAERGVEWMEVDYEALKGVESGVLRLF